MSVMEGRGKMWCDNGLGSGSGLSNSLLGN